MSKTRRRFLRKYRWTGAKIARIQFRTDGYYIDPLTLVSKILHKTAVKLHYNHAVELIRMLLWNKLQRTLKYLALQLASTLLRDHLFRNIAFFITIPS